MEAQSPLRADDEISNSTVNSEFLEKWGYDLEDLYKIALKFFKGKLVLPSTFRLF